MTWRAAMQQALYGDGGFYQRGERPAAHFRTSVHTSARYAAAVLALLRHTDAALGHPPRLDLVDIGAGQGELLGQVLTLAGQLSQAGPALAGRITAHAAEVAPRPPDADDRITWASSPPARITGLVVASEWLDNIPLDVAEQGTDGPCLVLVDPGTGAERTGPSVRGADLAWQRRWWPLGQPGERAELGHPRCTAWADVIRRLDRGLALAADYGHRLGSRPAGGTIAGYLDGRPVRPIPDGSRDITAHVAIDACAAAGIAAGASQTVLATQRAALRALGLTGCRPPLSQASADPAGYLAGLRRAAEEAELTDPAGFGAFSWLVQTVGMPLPGPLQRLASSEPAGQPGGEAGQPGGEAPQAAGARGAGNPLDAAPARQAARMGPARP